MYVEYRNPDPNIYAEVKQILDTGFNSTDPDEALAKRVKLIRMFIRKWDGKLQRTMIKRMQTTLSLATPGANEKPKLPNPKSYPDLTNKNNFDDLWDDTVKAFRDLESYYESKKYEDRTVVMSPVDRYVKMTESLKMILLPLEPKTKFMHERGRNKYHFAEHPDFPGHLIAEVSDARDIAFYRERHMKSVNYTADLPRFVCHEELPMQHSEAMEAAKKGREAYVKPPDENDPEDLKRLREKFYNNSFLNHKANKKTLHLIAVAKMGSRPEFDEMTRSELSLAIQKHQQEVAEATKKAKEKEEAEKKKPRRNKAWPSHWKD